ncbi:GHKL domain-containing protein, partial [bacterium]|nr:GHKL domain-containing protein [bacterium]NIO73675.1 GHKL domain-containing protein [bacterium]
AKMESGEKIRFEEKDLGNVLRNVVRELAAMAGEKKVRIKTVAKGEFPALLNPLIFGAFSNLINNAIKYSPENSEITIEIEDEDADWKICIADRGPGVLDENKKIIFERFKRVKKGDIKGTGLGLAIVKSVVDSHKGRVWVEDNPGGGSIFCVALPKITA